MHSHVALELSDFFALSNNSRTRGHNFKLFKNQFCLDVSKYFFSNRVIDMWNNLPEACVSSQTIINFKRNLMLCDLNLYLRGSQEDRRSPWLILLHFNLFICNKLLLL